ncbi:MAG: iron-containing redox enzyme family protein [Acidimicrobiia bacterium]
MDLKDQLDAAIEPWNLLDHPFYQAWNAGTLPMEALKTYAAEYGTFIAGIDAGWEQVGNSEHAAEEREHADLWRQFAATLGTDISNPKIPQVQTLLNTAQQLFSEPATAWGALYAFEAQQPQTAATKLVGLDTHYQVAEPARTYFQVHAGDLYEADMIVDELQSVDDVTGQTAVAACAKMSEALWDSLTGIHDQHK